MSGGFFRGTSADQDTRFSNKQAKLLKSQKFSPVLDQLVDMTKVKMDVMKPWIATRATELLGFEDEVLINFIYGLLDGKGVDGKQIQIQLTGFMEKNTGKFMRELWGLLLSAQSNVSGVPQQFLDEKEEETRKKKEESDKITQEIQKRMDRDGRRPEKERRSRFGDEADLSKFTKDASGGVGSKFSEPRDSSMEHVDGEADKRHGSLSENRRSRTPPSKNRTPSPRTIPSPTRSNGKKSMSRSRSISEERRKRRSPYVSSESPKHSISPRKRYLSPNRRSISPRRRYLSPKRRCISPRRRYRSPERSRYRSPRYSRSPPRRRSTYIRRRSPSPYRGRSPIPRRRSPRRRSPSPARRRLSPPRRRSPSPAQSISPSPVHSRSRSPPLQHRSPKKSRRSPSPSASPLPRSPKRRGSPYKSRTSLSPRRSPVPRSSRRRELSPVRSPGHRRADSSSSPPQRKRSPSPPRSRSNISLSTKHDDHLNDGKITERGNVNKPPAKVSASPQCDAAKVLPEHSLKRSISPTDTRKEDGRVRRSPNMNNRNARSGREMKPEPYSPKRRNVSPSPELMDAKRRKSEVEKRGEERGTREHVVILNKRYETKEQRDDEGKEEAMSPPPPPPKKRMYSDSEESYENERRNKRSDKHKGEETSEEESADSDAGHKEAKRKRKEEKRLRREERHKRREERHKRKMERRATKLKLKKDGSDGDDSETDQKRLEIQLREKALETLRAKKAITH